MILRILSQGLVAACVITGTLGLGMNSLGRLDAAAPQPAPSQPQPVPGSARAIAPIDLTGYWVSVVSEDWRWRMVTPQKGDYSSIPLNVEGRRVADTWDLAKDNAAGNQCKAFGIGGIVRQPGRLHITWLDDSTLKIDFDAGTQSRLLWFDSSKLPSGEKTWQGHSVAEWDMPGRGGRGGGGRGRGGLATQGGSLKIATTHFREGYLRKNGVPYSESASVTEYLDRLPAQPNGDVWLVVITTIDDPKYLQQPFFTSTHFKLEPNGSKWNPTPCQTDPPGQPTLK